MEIPGGFWASSLFNAVRWIPDSCLNLTSTSVLPVMALGQLWLCHKASASRGAGLKPWGRGSTLLPEQLFTVGLPVCFNSSLWGCSSKGNRLVGNTPVWHSWGFLTDFSPNLCKKLRANEVFVQISSQTAGTGVRRGCTNSQLRIWGAAVPLCSRVRASALCLLFHRLRLLPACVAVFFWISRKEEN